MCEPQECWERVVADELEVGDIVAGLPEHSLGSSIKIRDIIRYNLTMEIHSDWGDDPIFRESFVFRKKGDGRLSADFLAAVLNHAIDTDVVTRRIPDADDPRVKDRALEIASIERSDLDYTACTPPECLGDEIAKRVDAWIDQARRELESEGSDE